MFFPAVGLPPFFPPLLFFFPLFFMGRLRRYGCLGTRRRNSRCTTITNAPLVVIVTPIAGRGMFFLPFPSPRKDLTWAPVIGVVRDTKDARDVPSLDQGYTFSFLRATLRARRVDKYTMRSALILQT